MTDRSPNHRFHAASLLPGRIFGNLPRHSLQSAAVRLLCAGAIACGAVASAQAGPRDVKSTLTPCLAAQPAPEGLAALFAAKGWTPADTADPKVLDLLRMALLTRLGVGDLNLASPQTEWTALDQQLRVAAETVLAMPPPGAEGGVQLLSDPGSGSLLFLSVWTLKPGLPVIGCIYVATGATAQMQGHLPAGLPFTQGGFAKVDEKIGSPLSQPSGYASVLVPDPAAIAARLGHRPDVAAIFLTSFTYDLSLVTP